MSEAKMSVRELKLVLDKMPNEVLLDYSGGINPKTFQSILKIEIPFDAKLK